MIFCVLDRGDAHPQDYSKAYMFFCVLDQQGILLIGQESLAPEVPELEEPHQSLISIWRNVRALF